MTAAGRPQCWTIWDTYDEGNAFIDDIHEQLTPPRGWPPGTDRILGWPVNHPTSGKAALCERIGVPPRGIPVEYSSGRERFTMSEITAQGWFPED